MKGLELLQCKLWNVFLLPLSQHMELTGHFRGHNSPHVGERAFGGDQLKLRDRLALELVFGARRAEKSAIPAVEVRDALAFWFAFAETLAFFKRDFS